MHTSTIAFIGAGNMASSLIGGLLAQGFPSSGVRACDPNPEQRQQLGDRLGIQTFADNPEAVADADLVVLAVKPQVMKAVCLALAPHLSPQAVVVSIAAGISTTSLHQWLGECSLVRCMPNTPSLLQQGVSGLFAGPHVGTAQRQQAEQLLSAVGLVFWVEKESQLDAVTALSGSGPAYFFLLMEAMAQAAEQLGLPQPLASQLASQTALGAARMATESDLDAAELRRRVTSPQGTTEAAIHTFQQGHFSALVQAAMQAAAQRSAELTEQSGQ